MQAALLMIGGILVYLAVMMRFQRWEDHQLDVLLAERELRDAEFWAEEGDLWDEENIKERRNELRKAREKGPDSTYGTKWKRVKFNLGFLALLIPGLVLLLIWYAGHESEDDNWFPFVWAMLIAAGIWIHFALMKPMERLQTEVAWLRDTLKSVKDVTYRVARSQPNKEILRQKLSELGEGKDHDLG